MVNIPPDLLLDRSSFCGNVLGMNLNQSTSTLSNRTMRKILILRFSSFGDIVQCFSAADHLANGFPQAEIHWAVRSDSADLVSSHPKIHRILSLDRKSGWLGLWKLAKKMRSENYTHIYDAHCNLRSHLLTWILLFPFFGGPSFLRRKKHRIKRWFLLRIGWKVLPWPFRASRSFVLPLEKWNIRWQESLERDLRLPELPENLFSSLHHPDFKLSEAIIVAPSAAWEMKRWPIESWTELIRQMEERIFIVVGGPADDFCSVIQKMFPDRTINLAGKLSWLETSRLIREARAVVSGDTGVLHLSDYLNKPTFALIGPTAFGFPSWKNSKVIEIDLPCRPCTKDGRGKCSQPVYKKCLVDISPQLVSTTLRGSLL